jgi:ABC-type phosphate/phosphonate transport system permease subunit
MAIALHAIGMLARFVAEEIGHVHRGQVALQASGSYAVAALLSADVTHAASSSTV